MAMATVRWHGHVLRGEDGHDLRKALHCEDEGNKNRGQGGHGRSRLRKKA